MTVRVLLGLSACLILHAGEADLRRAFLGKQVYLKIDMPGTQQGVDLNLDRDDPMDWRQYSQRIKNFGVSIPRGRSATVTALVVKKDIIEFQLDGGGYGTFGDDTSTTVSSYVPKSRYENDLERDIKRETDPVRRRRLQADLDRERSRRYREERIARQQAEAASAIKRQEVMDKRMRGGSRFNLRHVVGIMDVMPEQMADWMREYVDFGGPFNNNMSQTPPRPQQMPRNDAPPRNDGPMLRRGMSIDEVTQKLGNGKLLSENVGADGILTQQWEYVTPDQVFSVTAVEGMVVKYAMKAR